MKKNPTSLANRQQEQFLRLLGDMLTHGFTLQESLQFMGKASSLDKAKLSLIQQALNAGETLSDTLAQVGFSPMITSQIYFAQRHGKLGDTLSELGAYLKQVQEYRNSFLKVLSYPLLLLVFLTIVILGIRQFLLPQLLIADVSGIAKLGMEFIQWSPLIGAVSLALIIGGSYLLQGLLKRKSPLHQADFYMKVPVIRRFYQDYLTAFISLEWGKLFVQGLETKAILQLMKNLATHPLLRELAIELEQRLILGERLPLQIERYSFFAAEFTLILQQGEMKGKVGKELILYSRLCYDRFFQRITLVIRWIQPVIFCIIALLILGVYGAMLLPIYGNMEEFL